MFPGPSIGKYFRARGALVTGSLLFCLSLPWYRSFDSTAVFGRWSYAYAAVLLVAALGWLALVFATWRTFARNPDAQSSVPSRLAGTAVLMGGAAYLWTTLADPATAGRFMNLNLLGSTRAVPALLEWLAMVWLTAAALAWVAKRLSPKLQNAGLAVASLIVLAVLGEGVARFTTIAFPTVQGFPTYSTRLWRDRYVTLNSIGYRDVEHSLLPDQGVRRALVIGDSYAFGTGTDDVADRFSEQLDRRLDAWDHGRWEVINGGRPDTHTLEHIEMLRPLLAYRPELVVLLYSFNDMDYLAPITLRGWTSGQPTLLDRLHPVPVLFQNSYLFQQIYVRFRKLIFTSREYGPSFDVYAADDLVERHRADLAQFVALAREANAVVKIVPFDNFLELNQAHEDRYRKVLAAAHSGDLPVCSLEHAFEGAPVTGLYVNSLDGHGTALAYKLAVDAAFDCVVAGLQHLAAR
jgi:hypothetical protein